MYKVEKDTLRFYSSNKKLRDCHHPVIEAFARAKVSWIRENINLDRKKVLEVGAGNGYISNCLMDICDLTALDISEEQLDLNPARKKVVSSVYKLPFKNDEFHCVICSNLLHHLERPQEAVNEITRVTRKFVVFSEPNNKNPLIWLQTLIQRHERNSIYYSKKFLLDLVLNSKLKVVNHVYSGGLVMPNGTPRLFLPLARSRTEHCLSLFQIIIAEKQFLPE